MLFRTILKKTLVIFLVLSWLLSGWPPLWNTPRFPPQVGEAFASQTTNSPSANTGSWTNSTNAYADGGGYANITSGAPSATHTFGTYGISVTGTVTQVRVRADALSIGGATVTTANNYPTADDSNTAAFTVSPLWSKVDDTSNTDFITGVTNAGGQATFTFSAFAVPTGSTITNVKITWSQKSTSTAAKGGASLKVGGTYYNNLGEAATTTGFVEKSYTATTNPKTAAAWTVAEVNGTDPTNPLQAFGVSSSDFNPDVQFGYVYATVTYTTANNETLEVDVSWDGGTSWSSSKHQQALTGTEATYWIDVTSDTSWTPTKLNDANFKVRVDGLTVGETGDVRLDWLPVEVTYTNLPTVTTQAASSVKDATATANGNITSIGGGTNDKEGFVYDTASKSLPGNVAPGSSGYASFAENSGSYSTGAFTVSLTGLSGGLTYYGRAYSHNSDGYAYGDEVSFTTAVISISITSDGIISYGIVSGSKDTTSSGLNDTQTARNDSTIAGDFNIKGADTASWTLAGTIGPNQYLHKFSTNGGSNWTALTTTYQTLASNIAASGTQNFDLQITAPTSSSSYAEQTASVTVQAVAH